VGIAVAFARLDCNHFRTSSIWFEGILRVIDETQLLELLGDLESSQVERTRSTSSTDKFCQVICAFANDMTGSAKPGYLLIGADDKSGEPSGLEVTDKLLKDLAGIASDGNVLPAPAMVPYKISLSSGRGDIAVVEVQPSNIPPVRYRGQIWIRRGPRRGIANESEEKILTERRVSGLLPFDSQACIGSSLGDLALDLFATAYRPNAIDPEIIAENGRGIEVQLASLRFFDLARNAPTHAGVLLFGKNPLFHIPHAYVQYVRYEGRDEGSDVASERMFSGDLVSVLRELDAFAKSLPLGKPIASSALSESMQFDFPPVAIRELLMNAVMHRAYDQPSAVRVIQFADRLEILSPGPLYGPASASNFPKQTSYRNPMIAEAMKVLGFVNRFGRGVARAQSALQANGSPPARFELGDTFFGATVEARP